MKRKKHHVSKKSERLRPCPKVVFRGFSFLSFQYGHVLHDLLPVLVWMAASFPQVKLAVELDDKKKIKAFLRWFDPDLKRTEMGFGGDRDGSAGMKAWCLDAFELIVAQERLCGIDRGSERRRFQQENEKHGPRMDLPTMPKLCLWDPFG